MAMLNPTTESGSDIVPAGYKRSEVGIIPEDWEVLKLSNLCKDIIDGTHFTPVYLPDGIPFYSVENVTANNFTDVKFISNQEHLRLLRRCRPERGDILLTRIGSIGETKLIDWDVNASIYVSLALLKLDDLLDANYIYAYSKCKQFIRDIESRSLTNATPKKINMGDIGNVIISAPPSRKEQRAIAEVLSDTDALITALDRLIAKKRAIKQATMQQLLTGKTRLPGFDGEWKSHQLGDILKVKHGRSQKGIMAIDGKYPILASGGEIGRTNVYLYNRPSVLIGRKGTIDNPQYITVPFWTVDTLFYTEISKDVAPIFIYFKFCMIGWNNYNEASGVPSLNARTIENIWITLPEEQEQCAIATVLSDMDAELHALEQRRAKTIQIKQGMMQQLLTGRIRLRAPLAEEDA